MSCCVNRPFETEPHGCEPLEDHQGKFLGTSFWNCSDVLLSNDSLQETSVAHDSDDLAPDDNLGLPGHGPRRPRLDDGSTWQSVCVSPPVSAGPSSTGFTGAQGPTRWPQDAVAPCATVVRWA